MHPPSLLLLVIRTRISHVFHINSFIEIWQTEMAGQYYCLFSVKNASTILFIMRILPDGRLTVDVADARHDCRRSLGFAYILFLCAVLVVYQQHNHRALVSVPAVGACKKLCPFTIVVGQVLGPEGRVFFGTFGFVLVVLE